jgi:hypothetical protein
MEVHRKEMRPTRVIRVVNDSGRWVEDIFGQVLKEEDPTWYVQKRVGARFTADQLATLVSRFVPRFWCPEKWFCEAVFVEDCGQTDGRREVPLSTAQAHIPAVD